MHCRHYERFVFRIPEISRQRWARYFCASLPRSQNGLAVLICASHLIELLTKRLRRLARNTTDTACGCYLKIPTPATLRLIIYDRPYLTDSTARAEPCGRVTYKASNRFTSVGRSCPHSLHRLIVALACQVDFQRHNPQAFQTSRIHHSSFIFQAFHVYYFLLPRQLPLSLLQQMENLQQMPARRIR